jgi:pimeloyl-ACP methyl ester carboxylesterase
MSPLPPTFVLVPGAWHTGGAWRDVIARLEQCGARAFAPTLVGHGPGALRDGLALADLVHSVVVPLVERDLRDVILVVHSLAGPVLPDVALALPERIRQVVLLNALVPDDGETALALLSDVAAPLLDLALATPGGSLPLPWELWLALWHDPHAAGSVLAASDRARVVYGQELSPAPLAPYLEPGRSLAGFCALGLPTTVLRCRQDPFLDTACWPRLVARLACPLVEMEGGHEPLYTRPHHLADTLLALSQQTSAHAA